MPTMAKTFVPALLLLCGLIILAQGARSVDGAGVTFMAAGGLHTCAVVGGGAQCWGDGSNGQLGDGSYESGDYTTPIDVEELGEGVQAVTAGSWHSCALLVSGQVRCWGRNYDGQLGDGEYSKSHNTPTSVVGLDGEAVGIDAGQFHTCALIDDGGIACWGSHSSGQLGDGTPASYVPRTLPVDVTGLADDAVAVSGGGRHTCALLENGGVQCWGSNIVGQLGNGTTVDSSTPVMVLDEGGDPLEDAVALSAGWGHTCVLTSGGGLLCWGWNDKGQLGDGTRGEGNFSTVPVQVQGLESGVSSVSGGGAHTCAVTEAGVVLCWGSNEQGQLAYIVPIPVPDPVPDGTTPLEVMALDGYATSVSSGDTHTCAGVEGGIVCWGAGYGFYPVTIAGLEPKPTTDAPTATRTATPTSTPGPSATPTAAGTTPPVDTATATSTPAPVQTNTEQPTGTDTATGTATSSPTETATDTRTPTVPTPTSTWTPTAPLSATPTPQMPGDAGCDNVVSAIDASLILQFAVELADSLACEAAADVNGDGTITAVDAVLVLQFVANLIGTLPV